MAMADTVESAYLEADSSDGHDQFFHKALDYSVWQDGDVQVLSAPPQDGSGSVLHYTPCEGLHLSWSDLAPYRIIRNKYTLPYRRIEIFLTESGQLAMTRNGVGSWQVPKGVGIFCCEGATGQFIIRPGEPVRVLNLMLKERYIRDVLEQRYAPGEFSYAACRNWGFEALNTDEAIRILLELKQGLLHRKATPMYCEGKVIELMAVLGREHKLLTESQPVPHPDTAALGRVRDAIVTGLQKPPDLDVLCGLATMGKTKLRESFRQQFGVSIGEYIRRQRMMRALILLDNPAHKISSVAAMLGYVNAGKFAATFREFHGCTPREYRLR